MEKQTDLYSEKITFEYISTNGIKLYTAFAGPKDGTPVILLHGFPDFWYGWKNQIEFLAKKGFRVIAPNQRGYYLSDKPKGVKNYLAENLVADIIRLADTLKIEKFYLGGHDWGGFVAWALTTRYPNRIRKLFIANMPHPLVMNRYIKEHKSQRKKSWYIFFFQLRLIPEFFLKITKYRFLISAMSKSLSREEKELYKEAWKKRKAITSMINWYRGSTRKNAFHWIIPPKITVPTLIVWGKKDAFLSHEMATLSIVICDGGRLEFIKDATHWVLQEKPEEVNTLLSSFFD